MPLVTASAYPVDADPSEGWALVKVDTPYQRSWDLVNEQLVDAAREHAGEWERFAEQLRALLDAGWALQSHAGIYASRATTAAELPGLLDGVAEGGIVAEWCVADGNGGLFPVGGTVAGVAEPPDTFPGALLPALVENDLTGAQRLVESAEELRAVVTEEVRACADWWRSHPEQLSDHAAHGLVEELDQLVDALSEDPVPLLVSEPANGRRIFEEAPSTRVAVHPVSAVVFTGLMEATNNHSSLTLGVPPLRWTRGV